jgi:hypothetical protein
MCGQTARVLSLRRYAAVCCRMLPYAAVCGRMRPYARARANRTHSLKRAPPNVMLTHADVC